MKYLLPLLLLVGCSTPKQEYSFLCITGEEKYEQRHHNCVLKDETADQVGVVCNNEEWTTWLLKSECVIMNEVDCDKNICLMKVIKD